MTIRISAQPSTEPVSLSEAKAHLRVDIADDDTLISSLITAARQILEVQAQRQFVTATWVMTLDKFPLLCKEIRLLRPPIASVTSIYYLNSAGTSTLLAAADYRVDSASEPGRITPAYGKTWPIAYPVTNAVTVTYSAGYGAASAVPKAITQAILLLVGHWYENREAVQAYGGGVTPLPMAVDALVAPFRVMEMA
ncbi:MAG: phage head-tail connector protein [Candidatus Atribacteria bacterium]|nr:phage head-tail connector protein [Candidatus Atribacteria bacterium]